jgi:hypothetical protein
MSFSENRFPPPIKSEAGIFRDALLGQFPENPGVGYTCLRQADRSLPNVLAWE